MPSPITQISIKVLIVKEEFYNTNLILQYSTAHEFILCAHEFIGQRSTLGSIIQISPILFFEVRAS